MSYLWTPNSIVSISATLFPQTCSGPFAFAGRAAIISSAGIDYIVICGYEIRVGCLVSVCLNIRVVCLVSICQNSWFLLVNS